MPFFAGFALLIKSLIDSNNQRQANQSAREAYRMEIADRDRLIADEREYNKPVNQSKRLLEAGINPYYAISGSGNTTTAGAVIEAPKKEFNVNPLNEALNLLEIARSVEDNERQNEYLALQKQKLQADILFGSEMNEEKLKSERTGQEVDSLRADYIRLQKRALEADLAESDDFDKWAKRAGPVVQLLKVILPYFIGQKRRR